jgi:hypothetical protein
VDALYLLILLALFATSIALVAAIGHLDASP